MGIKSSKTQSAEAAAPAAAPQAAFQLFRVKQVYRLHFKVNIVRTKEGRKLRRIHVDDAKERLRDLDMWAEYLESTMRDAILDEMEHQYPDVDFSGRVPDVPCSEIRVHLSRRWPAEALGEYHAYVQWTSAKCDLDRLAEAVGWRIGDRMSQYEVTDEDVGWHAFITPGDLVEK